MGPVTRTEARFFITGSTGYTGRAVLAQLSKSGLYAIAHVRPNSKNVGIMSRYELDRSPWDERALAEALDRHRITHVMALIGTTKAKAKKAAMQGIDASYEAVDRDCNLMLIKAACRAKDRPRFIYLSSMGAEKPRGNRYLEAREAVEAELKTSKLSHLIARPAFISGPDRSEFRLAERTGAIALNAALGFAALLGGKRIRNAYGTLSAEALAAGLIRLGMSEKDMIAGPTELRGGKHAPTN